MVVKPTKLFSLGENRENKEGEAQWKEGGGLNMFPAVKAAEARRLPPNAGGFRHGSAGTVGRSDNPSC